MNGAVQRLEPKVVFYGPALSGKTTNLTRLHDLVHPELKGEILSLETQGDRTLFFDLLPLGFRAASGLLLKFKLFTVPGQVAHDGTRKAVLSRADAVVFVADSDPSQALNNAVSFENLAENCERVGLDFMALPLVVQFNKRDLPQAVPEAEIRSRWQAQRWPLLMASALQGQGVLETWQTLLDQLYPALDAREQLADRHGLDAQTFVRSAMGVRDA